MALLTGTQLVIAILSGFVGAAVYLRVGGNLGLVMAFILAAVVSVCLNYRKDA
jgi:hypothetical protein